MATYDIGGLLRECLAAFRPERGTDVFSHMKVHCPICKAEIDGMKAYGREALCCDKECYEEWEWRRTLAIMGKPYKPRPGSRWDDNTPVEEFVAKHSAEREANPFKE